MRVGFEILIGDESLSFHSDMSAVSDVTELFLPHSPMSKGLSPGAQWILF